MRMGRDTLSPRAANIVWWARGLVGLVALLTLWALVSASSPVARLAPGQGATRFRLEDTRVKVDEANSFGRDIAWSHGGDRIAYFYGDSVWIVPVDHWDQTEEAYELAHYFDPWSLEQSFLAWSPDDAMIALNLRQDRDPKPAEWYIGQVDWQRHTLSFLALEPATGMDWSSDDRIAGYLGGNLAIYDIRSLRWKTLAVPERFANFSLRPTAWTADSHLLLAGLAELDYSKSEWADTIFLANVQTAEWEMLPVQAFGTTAYRPQPVPSPDGRWIAWIEDRVDFEPRVWRIMLYDRTQAQVVEAANSRDNDTGAWQSLSWGPDSDRLAFSATRLNGPNERHKTMWILHLDQSP